MPGHLLDANTLALWRFNETSNAQSSLTAFQTVSGVSKQPTFDGVNDAITMGDFLSFERTTPFSISIWFSSVASIPNTLFSKARTVDASTGVNRGWRIFVTNTPSAGQLYFRLENNDISPFNRISVFTTVGGLNEGKLHHAVISYTGSSTAAGVTIYIDGVAVTKTIESNGDTLTQTTISPATLTIGGLDGVGTYNGGLEHASVWNIALSAPQVSEVYNSGMAPNLLATSMAANLVGWWKVDGSDNLSIAGGIIDQSTGAHNGTAIGGLTYYKPDFTRFPTSPANTMPGIAGGPRQFLAFPNETIQDNCRWINSQDNALRGLSAPNHTIAMATLLGAEWTFEAWVWIDRPGSVGVLDMNILSFSASGESLATNYLMRMLVTGEGFLNTFWEFNPSTNVNLLSTGTIPRQQWVHIAITGKENGANRDIQFFSGGVSIGTASGTKASGGTSSAWFAGITEASTAPMFGGLAYLRVSRKVRTLSEIQAAAADPSTITNDNFTTAFWDFQEGPNNRDIAQYGVHVQEYGLINGVTPVAPFDLYGVDGINRGDRVKLYNAPSTDNSASALPRNEVAILLSNNNPLTIEAWIRPDQFTTTHLVVNAGGTGGLEAVSDNTAINFGINPNQTLIVSWEGQPNVYNHQLISDGTISSVPANQSGEAGRWYHIACRKIPFGNIPLWFFDGTNDSISMAHAGAYSFDRHQAFTIIAWLQTNVPALQHIAGKANTSATITGYTFGTDASGRLFFRMGNGTTQFETRVTSTAITAGGGVLHCAAVTYNGNSQNSGVSLYMDGTLQSMTNSIVATLTGTILSASLPFTIARRNNTDQPYAGFLKEISVWDRALSAAEITEAFGKLGRPQPNLLTTSMVSNLLSYWKLDASDTGLLVNDKVAAGIWDFDGIDDFIDLGALAQLNPTPTTPFTASIWCQFTGTTPVIMFGKNDFDANFRGWFLMSFPTGTIYVGLRNSNALKAEAQTPGISINNGTRHHVVFIHTGTGTVAGFKVFVDGVQQTLTTITDTLAGNSTTSVVNARLGGSAGISGITPYNGRLSHASYWNIALSDAQVAEVYGNGTPPNLSATSMVANLVAWWKLNASDTTAVNGVIDYGPNGFSGTANGGITPTPNNGAPQNGAGPTQYPSSTYDFFVDGQPLETVGPLIDPVFGDVYTASNMAYLINNHVNGVTEARGDMRISKIARTDAEILESFNRGISTGVAFNYKMRAVDSGRPAPGYIYWVAPFPDFDATLVANATPPLIGSVVAGSVIELSRWPSG